MSWVKSCDRSRRVRTWDMWYSRKVGRGGESEKSKRTHEFDSPGPILFFFFILPTLGFSIEFYQT